VRVIAMAAPAGNEDDLLYVGHGGPLAEDVLELDLHGGAGVQLQSEQTADAIVFGAVIGDVRHGDAVDFLDEAIAPGNDVVIVPVFLIDFALELSGIAEAADDLDIISAVSDNRLLTAFGEDGPSLFVVVRAGPSVRGIDIRLVTLDDVVTEMFGAVLDAAVSSDDAIPELEFKVVEITALPDEKGIALEGMFHCGLAGDGTVPNHPVTFHAIPALEAFTVKDGFEALVLEVVSAMGEGLKEHCSGEGERQWKEVSAIHDLFSRMIFFGMVQLLSTSSSGFTMLLKS